jgi:glycerol uptake facilitator-like aquaporin
MLWLHGWPWQRVISLWVALALGGIAVAMVLFALSDEQMVAFVRSLALPGQPVPDTSMFDGGTLMALAEAIIAAALSAAVIAFPSRIFFGTSAASAVLAFATGAWTLLGIPRPLPIDVGPIVVPMLMVGIALTLMAIACLAGCLVGWFVFPSESHRELSYMPPPRHQGG